MITKFKLFENQYGTNVFHCYIPYSNRELFIIALSKIDVDNSIANELFEYFDRGGYFDEERYIGFFLRFSNDKWDFYEIEHNNTDTNINNISKKLEDPTYNTDGIKSALPEDSIESLYIGKITVTNHDIELYDNIKKYNL